MFVLSIVTTLLAWIVLWPYHWIIGWIGMGMSAYVVYSAFVLNTETLRTYLSITEFLERPGLSRDEAVKRVLRRSRKFGYCGIQGMNLALRDKGIGVTRR